MTDKHTQEQADHGNMEKDPKDWVTGDEPMTGAQRSYLKTLSEEAKEPFDESLTKADASRRIDELQRMTGRGQHGGQGGDRNQGSDGHVDSRGGTPPRSDARDAPSRASPGEGGVTRDAELDARFAPGADGSRGNGRGGDDDVEESGNR